MRRVALGVPALSEPTKAIGRAELLAQWRTSTVWVVGQLALAADPPMEVRELEFALSAISHRIDPAMRTQECRPFAILNVDVDGNFSTYSPELLGLSSPRHGSFSFGNVPFNPYELRIEAQGFATATQIGSIVITMKRCRRSAGADRFAGSQTALGLLGLTRFLRRTGRARTVRRIGEKSPLIDLLRSPQTREADAAMSMP